MMLWDTAGQEEYDALTRTYYRGAAACVFVFSTTDEESLRAIPKWYDKVVNECGKDIAMAIVQNKVDKLEEAKMTPRQAEEMADMLKIKLYRSCVKENINVGEVFEYVAVKALEIDKKQALEETSTFKKSSSNSSLKHQGFQGGDKEDGQRTSEANSVDENEDGGNITSSSPGPTIDFRKPSKQRTGGRKSRACSIH